MIGCLGCYSKDYNNRISSSSGGIFPILANKILDDGGVVYGAVFSEDYSVEHIRIDSKKDVNRLKGSKYVFSKLNNIFTKVKGDLDSKKKVLFSGTPCQVAGLSNYLKKKYDNLIMIDFICHGSPHQDMWEKYLSEVSKGKKIKNISFRDKREGWKNYNFVIEFEKGEVIAERHENNVYMKGFLENFTLRKACYNCKNKGVDNRLSDITLGDLWGVEKLIPTMSDDLGMSLVLFNSDKGYQFFNKISEQLNIFEINVNEALDMNMSALISAKPNPMSNLWLYDYEKSHCFIKSLSKYTKTDLFHRIYYKILKYLTRNHIFYNSLKEEKNANRNNHLS